ncbi:MAG TPA: AI-2E family transporter [Terriglobales bacterium]|jgi:predicted PurR-regulated permease PerM|nr:AI-2E family transporter [Terriglobales bacterium]
MSEAEKAGAEVNITTRPRNWALNVIAIGVMLGLLYLGELVLVTILISVLLTFILAPVVDFLVRLRLHVSLASLVAVALLVVLVYGVFYFSYSHAETFFDNLPQYSKQIRAMLGKFRQKAEDIQKTTELVPPTNEEKTALKVRPTTNWTDIFSHGFTTVTDLVLATSFVPFLIFFMLSWRNHVRSATVMLFPLEHRHAAFMALGLIANMVRAFILGNLVVGLFMSVLSVGIFWFLHVPFFYFVGFISGFLSLVPYLGVVLAIVPPLAVGVGAISPADVLIIAASVIALHIFAINVLYPMVLGRRLALNPLALTISLLFWGWMWGAVGLVLAVPITGTLKIIFDHIESMKPYAEWLGD